MKGVEVIERDGVTYAIVVRGDVQSDQRYNFICPDHYPFQLGVSFYRGGDVVRDHEHLPRQLSISMFQELVLVTRGRAAMRLYDGGRRLIGTWSLASGDLVLLIAGGHGFDMLEDTKIVEVKQGPFDPRTSDKVFI